MKRLFLKNISTLFTWSVGLAFLGVAAIIWSFYVSIVILWGYLGLAVLIFGGGLPYWAQTVSVTCEGIEIKLFGKVKKQILWADVCSIENYWPRHRELLRVETKDYVISFYHYKRIVAMLKQYYPGDTSRLR